MRKLKPAEYIFRDTLGFIEGIFKTHKEATEYAKSFSHDGLLRSVMRSPVEWYRDGKLITETTLPEMDYTTGMRYWGKTPPMTKEELMEKLEKGINDYIEKRKEWEKYLNGESKK